MENARLTRLKTLAVRTKIPDALFYPLDELLKNDKWIVVTRKSTPTWRKCRQILEGMFLRERNIDNTH